MEYYVYIIQSEVDRSFYKGFTENPKARLLQHNHNLSRYTSRKTPWTFVFLKSFETKRDALIFEKKIKSWNNRSLIKLINSPENEHLSG